MHRDLLLLDPGLTITEGEAQMRATGARHAVVVAGGRLVGLVSHRDMLEAVDRQPAVRVADVMRPEPWTATELTTVAEAARLMLRRRIGCLPVVRTRPDGGEVVGLLGEADLLRAAYV